MRSFSKSLCLAGALAGCAPLGPQDPASRRISDEVAVSERSSRGSVTISNLAMLERSINDFIHAKGRIPARLDELIPDYIAGIPEVTLGDRRHDDSKKVRYYPASVIQEGQINGAAIEDTGGWGYAFDDKQVIIFVDCTHKRPDGGLWYRARGVY